MLAPLAALACATALAAGAGAQGGSGAISPSAPAAPPVAPVDTGLARFGASILARPDSLLPPGARADSAAFDSLVYDSARGGWRVVVPRED